MMGLLQMNVFGLNTVLGFVPQLRDLPVVQQVARHVNSSAPDQQMRISAPCLHSFLDTFLYSPHSLFTQPQPHPPQPPPQTPQQTTPPSPPPPHSPQAVPLEQARPRPSPMHSNFYQIIRSSSKMSILTMPQFKPITEITIFQHSMDWKICLV